jgi:RND family efflux transporter MFP subunit
MKIQFNTLVTSLLTTGVLFISCSGNDHEVYLKNDQPVLVTVGFATKQSDNTIQASGRIEPKETAIISTRVMGLITIIKVKAGDEVRKGQLLVTINNADILSKRAQAVAMVSEAEAALKDAERDYERFGQLYEQNSASKKEFESATLHYNSMRAKTEAARQMQNEAEAMLAYTNLTAPFSGVVTQKNVNAGSMANPGMPILIIEQIGNYQVSATISETEIANIKNGNDVSVTIKSTGKTISGSISEISPSAQFSGGQYSIKVSLPENEKTGVYSGMYVTITIHGIGTDTTNNNVLVPSSAIVNKDQLTGLYTITENQKALLRWVRLGKVLGDQVEVLSGLRSDEKFILESEGKLYNGAAVAIK